MTNLAAASIISSKRSPTRTPPDRRCCVVVSRVASGSPAAQEQVQPGDYLCTVNGRWAAGVDLLAPAPANAQFSYVFHAPETGMELRLVTSVAPLGISVEPTNEAIAAEFAAKRPEYFGLGLLWDRGEWPLLVDLCQIVLGSKTLMGSLASLLGKGDRNSPALALRGAALVELGRAGRGHALLHEYEERYQADWPPTFRAVVLYYKARTALASGDRTAALALLTEAFAIHPYRRIAAAVTDLTGAPPVPAKPCVGAPFPVAYELRPATGEGPAVSLERSLAALTPDQALIVCLLGTSRGEGAYNEFIRRYRRLAVGFPDFLRGLHVLAGAAERDARHPEWYEEEDRARADALPLAVLLDDGTVTKAVPSPQRPCLLLVSQDRRVLDEGALTDVELWEVLNARHPA